MSVDFQEMTNQWQELVMDSWGKMARQTVQSDEFAAASNACLDWTLSWQKEMRNQSGQFMDLLELPKRSDVARLSKQVLAAEERVAECEEKLDEMVSLLKKIQAGQRRKSS